MGSLGGSSSKSSSKPLTPTQVQGYYNQLDANTGGRLADFAMNGTQPTQYTPIGAPERVTAPSMTAASLGYQPTDVASQLKAPGGSVAARVKYNALSPEQVTALGGLGALREQMARRQNAQTLAQYAADPSLSVYQRLRANQLENQNLSGTLDALAQEREAGITGLLSDQALRTLQADTSNQAASTQVSLANAQNALAYQGLLADTLGDQEARALQAALADQAATNQAAQFNAGQQATADQFNAGLGTSTALTEAQRQYMAQLANAGLPMADMQALANIYFGGQGTTYSQSQSGGLSDFISFSPIKI